MLGRENLKENHFFYVISDDRILCLVDDVTDEGLWPKLI